MWGTLSVTLAGFISNVIYGLRRDVKEAREFGQYQLLEMIGAGGMGFVYRARHRMLRRDTALKLLPPTRSSAQAIARFEREVQLTARLSHPHTVTIFDYGRTPDGLFYYTMELLEGATLEDIVTATGPMPPARVVRVVRQIAGALAEAHELGLVHRDIKPSNIMLCARGGESDVAKVLDFGLVREQVTADVQRNHKPGPGLLLGTPHYLSPEAIAQPAQVGPASDLYSLGAVAYYMLAGAPPFEAGTVVELCAHHLWSEPPPLPGSAAVPAPLEALIRSALAKEPAARPRGAQALAERLDALSLSGWSAREARAWWSENGARVSERRAAVSRSPDTTRRAIEVDLDRITHVGAARP
jgi:eukaryotic-like serine/threonine-protein kinase